MDAQDTLEVDRFILDRIDSIPHLEGLLLLWRTRSIGDDSAGDDSTAHLWSAQQLAQRLWISDQQAREILNDLLRFDLVEASGGERYSYRASPEQDRLVQRLESAYAREMIRITRLVHSKASSAVREFARAFRFTKDKG